MKSFCVGFVAGLFFMWSAIPTFISGIIVGVVLISAYPSFGNDFYHMAFRIANYFTDLKPETIRNVESNPANSQESDSISPKDKLQ